MCPRVLCEDRTESPCFLSVIPSLASFRTSCLLDPSSWAARTTLELELLERIKNLELGWGCGLVVDSLLGMLEGTVQIRYLGGGRGSSLKSSRLSLAAISSKLKVSLDCMRSCLKKRKLN